MNPYAPRVVSAANRASVVDSFSSGGNGHHHGRYDVGRGSKRSDGGLVNATLRTRSPQPRA